MKTKLFIAAALLITGTTFSQTVSTKNEASSRASASASSNPVKVSGSNSLSSRSSASADVNAASKVESASRATSEVKQSGDARLDATKKEIRKDYEQVNQEAEASERISAGVYGGTNGNVDATHNKGGSNASINTAKGISASSTLGSETVIITKAGVKAKNATAPGIKAADKRVKSKAKASGARSQVDTRSKVSLSGSANQAGMKTGIKSNIGAGAGLSIK